MLLSLKSIMSKRSRRPHHCPRNIGPALVICFLLPMIADAFILQKLSTAPRTIYDTVQHASSRAATGCHRNIQHPTRRAARCGQIPPRCAASGSSPPPPKGPFDPTVTDYYAILHVPRDAPATRIKQARSHAHTHMLDTHTHAHAQFIASLWQAACLM